MELNGKKDDLYDEAVRLVLEHGRPSTTFLQRMLKTGYTRASMILNAMEANGIVGPERGTHARKILISNEDIDITGAPIPKRYIKISDGSDSYFVELLKGFNIGNLYNESDPEEKWVISFIDLTDNEFESLPEFQGF